MVSVPDEVQVAIIGGGFGGIGIAIRLLGDGVTDFTILEKAEQFGGTWRENTYPGCACDVPSQLYSYSFAKKADWSRVFAKQAEIQEYLLETAGQYGLRPYARFGCRMEKATWDDHAQRWLVETNQGPIRAKILVIATGPLHFPNLPDLPGLAEFEGTTFHTARWRHDHDIEGRRVAVIGTGSSAIQLVPKIQPKVGKLTLFQRTAPWVLPKPDHRIPSIEKAMFRYLPGFQLAYRFAIFAVLELMQLAQRRPAVMRQIQRVGLWQLRRQVRDKALREQLTPNFVLGCKRLLLSNTYYPALQQPNVEFVPLGVQRVTPKGVVDADGREHEVDTIIFATGFKVTDSPIADCVIGKGGSSLADAWKGTPQAYIGTTVTGFPNMFHAVGPNLGNGHTSYFLLLEAQARYLASALKVMARGELESVEVRADVQARYNEEVQAALVGTVWNAGGCASYYLDKNGVNSSIYPWTTIDLRRRLARFDPAAYVRRGPSPALTAETGSVRAAPIEPARVGAS